MTRFLVYNPVATEVEVAEPRPRTDRAFRESRALVFHNDKPHAREAMLHIVDELSSRYGIINLGGVARPTSTSPDPAVFDQVARDCDWAIVGACD